VARQFSEAILVASRSGALRLERVGAERFDAACQLRLRSRNKPAILLTGLTSFAVMRELGIRDVLTRDAHFAQAHLGFRRVPSA
jgi:predicted nucleic acid-binding protein